jgi:hypothetical protein
MSRTLEAEPQNIDKPGSLNDTNEVKQKDGLKERFLDQINYRLLVI